MRKIIISILLFMMLLLTFFSGCLNDNNTIDTLEEIFVNINGGADFNNIQDAINQSNNGTTILVWNGSYNQNIRVNKSVTIIGNSSTNTTVYNASGNGTGAVINITSDWVNISGLCVTNRTSYISCGLYKPWLIRQTPSSRSRRSCGRWATPTGCAS